MAKIIKMYMCTGPEVIHLLTNAYPAEYSTYLMHKPTLLAITSHINTRKHANFYQPSVNVAKYQKGVYYLGVKIFNTLPSDIKAKFNNPKKFKVVLQKNYYIKNLFIPWMNISTFRIVKFTFGYTSTNLYYNLFVYYLKKVL